MRLLRCKVSGHFVLRNSGWFTVDSRSTAIAAPAGSGKSTLFRALRSVNPPACDSAPAPFTEFPKYVSTGGYRRKVLPAKKTAVIAVFICDDRLREELAAIDPVYWETDRIEVGRRLDNSKWITFVEIAASGRWSELEEEIGPLREMFGETAELAAFRREGASLQPTDRIKGRLAERLHALLDRLAGQAVSEEQQYRLQRLRSIVDRAARYRKAVRAVQKALPVLVHLDRDCLLSGCIDVGAAAGDTARQHGGCQSCADYFLQELLKIRRIFSGKDGNDRINSRLQEQAPRLEKGCRQLTERLRNHLPDLSLQLSLSPAEGRIEVLASIAGEVSNALNKLSAPLRWMLSCAISSCYFRDFEKKEVVFLLDEPDVGLSNKEKNELAAFMIRLSSSHQVLVCSADSPFPPASQRQYRLQTGEDGSTIVDIKEDLACRGLTLSS